MSDLFTATTAAQVEEALARGGDIEEERERKETPLISAIRKGELEVVDCLLNHGANPRHRPAWFMGPIQLAATLGHAAIAERLVKAGADINDNEDGRGNTALIFAARNGFMDVVDCLLSLGANIEAKDSDERTALMTACHYGSIDVVDRLLAAGANPHVIDKDGNTALILAAGGGHLPIIDRLLILGVDINHRNRWGRSNALMKASLYGRTEVVDRLLSVGCDINAQDHQGETALMKGCAARKIDVVKLLLDNGADPNIVDEEGRKAFQHSWPSPPEIRTLLNGLILLSFHHHHHHHVPWDSRIDPKPQTDEREMMNIITTIEKNISPRRNERPPSPSSSDLNPSPFLWSSSIPHPL